MKSLSLLSSALLGVVLTGALRGDDIASADGKFLQDAASGGLLEVKLGQLATERAQDAEVRQFGARMVTDHNKANLELMAVALKNGIKISEVLNKKHQEVFDKFKNMRGPEFDRAYMKHMVKDHEEDVAEFTKESQAADNAQVRALATSTLATIREHLRMARAIADRLK